MPGDGGIGWSSPGRGAAGTSVGIPGISGVVICAIRDTGDANTTSGAATNFSNLRTLISVSPKFLGRETMATRGDGAGST
jgi:hypothetical protein